MKGFFEFFSGSQYFSQPFIANYSQVINSSELLSRQRVYIIITGNIHFDGTQRQYHMFLHCFQ
jgi:hypothetical protein